MFPFYFYFSVHDPDTHKHPQEALCDLLDDGRKETLEVAACREASEKSPRAFWAFRRLGYLQVSFRFLSHLFLSLINSPDSPFSSPGKH